MSGALLVDFERLFQETKVEMESRYPDNYQVAQSAAELIKKALDRFKKRGNRIIVSRAYADWNMLGVPQVQSTLTTLGIQPKFAGSRKDGTFGPIMDLSLDMYQLHLKRSDLDLFVMIGVDEGYAAVIQRIVEDNKTINLVGFPKQISGRIVEIVGRERFVDATDFLHSPPEPEPPKPAKLLHPDDIADYQTSYRNKTIGLLLEAERMHGSGIWLTPFFRNYMNTHFDFLTHEQRKGIIEALKEEKVITVRTEGPAGAAYSVLYLNHEHASVIDQESLTS